MNADFQDLKNNELPRAEAPGILGQRPEMPPLRSGRPFIPELKSSGFSGRFYKIEKTIKSFNL
jgi:hypothetical protein